MNGTPKYNEDKGLWERDGVELDQDEVEELGLDSRFSRPDEAITSAVLETVVAHLDRSANELEAALVLLTDMEEDKMVSDLIDAQIAVIRAAWELEKR